MQYKMIKAMLFVTVSLYVGHQSTANAGIYQCDNDRAASQYPHCTNTLAAGWSYRTGTGADWNGDSRLSNAGVTTSYAWNFFGLSSGSRIGVRVWLANAAFTDPAATYFMVLPGITFSHGLNQNTAPSGWSNLGPVPAWASNPRLSVKASGTGRTGADIVELTTLQGLTAEPPAEAGMVDAASCGVTPTRDAGVLAIQQRMLDAIDHYRDVKGSYQISFQNNGQDDKVVFEISERTPGSHVTTTSRSGEVIDYRSDGHTLATTDAIGQVVRTANLAVTTPPAGLRQYYNDACEAVYVHRLDPAVADAASDVVLPQNYAFWLSDSDARITGADVVAGRKAIVIEGDHEPYLAAKLGATGFKMWVDGATGTLLKLVGSDERGAAVYSIVVDSIEFDRGVDPGQFTVAAPANR